MKTKFKNIFFLILVILINTVNLTAQKYMNKGDKYFNRNLFEEAIPYYQKEIEKGPYQAKLASREKLADCYRLTGRFFEAEEMYEYLMKQNKRRKKPEYFLNYAKSLKSSAKYEEAAEQFMIYIEKVPDDPMGPVFLESCYRAQAWLDQEIEYIVKNFEQVNTPDSDFSPVYYKDGIVFSSSREGSEKKFISLSDEITVIRMDLYFQNLLRDQGEYKEIVGLKDLNSHLHDAAPTFSKDGSEVYFSRSITGKKDKKTNSIMNSLQIFHSSMEPDGSWREPRSAFDFNSTTYSVGQPSLSSDGKKIYFVSDMPGGYGGTDIYYCEKQKNNSWGEPKNLGEEVNSFGHELFPYIHGTDTLYFSSDTHPGMGKLDLFRSVRDGKRWKEISNLKPPLNSIGNDFGITMNQNQETGFFSSDRFNGTGAEDIYSFMKFRPTELMVCGDELRIPDSELYDGITHKIKEKEAEEQEIMQAQDGQFTYPVETGKVYELVSRKDGFFHNKIYLVMRAGSGGQAVSTIISKNHPVRVSRLFIEQETSTVNRTGGRTDTVLVEKPLKDNLVTLMTDEEKIEEGVTDASGLVLFSTILEAGPAYHIEAHMSEQARELHVKAGKTEISGEVRYQETGLLVEGARILLLEDGFPEQEVTTSANGEFRFMAAPDRKFSVLAAKEGYPHEELPVPDLSKGKAGGIILVLQKKGETTTSENKAVVSVTAYNPMKASVTIIGTVRDEQSAKSLEGSLVYLLEDGFPEQEVKTGADGEFSFKMTPGMDYALLAVKRGYFYQSVELSPKNPDNISEKRIDIGLSLIKEERVVQLDQMSFADDGTTLQTGSMKELFKLKEFMKINPSLRIEVGAFSGGNLGADKSRKVSQMRAESVCSYLKKNSIGQDRVWARGLGSSDHEYGAGDPDIKSDMIVGFQVLGKGPQISAAADTELTEASLTQADTVWNIIFSVQIGAYRKTVKSSLVEKYRKIAGDNRFNQFTDNRGLTLFQVGGLFEFGEADKLRNEMLEKGIQEAFVVAYNNDERMSITKARRVTRDPLLTIIDP
ncbi:MAG: hypothetical protein GY790_10535 [Bacteroidetes bacterium]|nr:hypothetical protein [Bacteroidota bacterium]